MTKKLRVLLIGPRDPEKFEMKDAKWLMGGESTYITSLLENPPEGVEYVWWEEAIKKFKVQISNFKVKEPAAHLYKASVYESKWQKVWVWLHKLRILPLSPGVKDLVIQNGDEFDVVHCHAYSLRLRVLKGKRPKVVLSDSSSNSWTLREYFRWSKWRISFYYGIKRWLYYRLWVADPDLMTGDFQRLVVWSEWAKSLVKERVGDERVVVIPPGISIKTRDHEITRSRDQKEVTILFVGTWFERKGGRVLVEAVKRLVDKRHETSYKRHKLRLVLIGQVPKDVKEQLSDVSSLMFNVEMHDYVSRNELLNKFYPQANIFVLPVLEAEGFGVAVIEAMSFGIPVVVSEVCALPEIVGLRNSKFEIRNSKFVEAEAGLVVKARSIESLEAVVAKLIYDRQLRERLGMQAGRRFRREFSAGVTKKKLGKMYRSLVKGIRKAYFIF